jgi:cobyrinic acid a,c-diamide synthase
MVLGETLVDAQGHGHAMAGLLALETSFSKRKMSLGYRRAKLLADCRLGSAGSAVRGHEFHYSTMVRAGDQPLFSVEDANGADLGTQGSRRGRVTGSYFHVIDRGD